MSSLRRQGAWSVVDQVLSSGTNFLPALVLARVLGPADYGTFSIAFLAWFSALQVLRSALMRPYTLAAASLEGASWNDVTRRASGAVVLGGGIFGGVFAITAAVIGTSSDLGQAFLVIAVLAPGLALQEFWRVAAFAASRARTAAANDLCWAIGQVVAFGVLLSLEDVTVASALVAWGVGAWIAAGLGMLQLSVTPRVDLAAVRWAKQSGRLGAWFTLESSVHAVGMFVVMIIIAAENGNEALGFVRAVINLFGPVQLLTMGAASIYLPHLVRVIKKPGSTGFGESVRYSLVLVGTVTVYGLVVLVTASTLLTKVFGPEYAPATALVLPALIAFVLDTAGSGALLLLSARAMVRRLTLATLAGSVVQVGAVAALGSVAGLRGALWGLAIGSAVKAVASWLQVVKLAAPEPRSRDAGAPRRTSPAARF